jgi:hypothetical protein
MSATLRLTSCAAVAGLVLVGVHVLRPIVLAPLETDLSGAPGSLRDFFEEQERGQTLQKRLRAAQARLAVQERICRDLINGRISLVEAARSFGELPDAPDNFWELLRRYYHGATDEERLGRLVIRWVCEELRDEPERAQRLRHRLETELKIWVEELRRQGQAGPPHPATAR